MIRKKVLEDYKLLLTLNLLLTLTFTKISFYWFLLKDYAIKSYLNLLKHKYLFKKKRK